MSISAWVYETRYIHYKIVSGNANGDKDDAPSSSSPNCMILGPILWVLTTSEAICRLKQLFGALKGICRTYARGTKSGKKEVAKILNEN